MQDIPIRAGAFVLIIVLGYILRKVGFFTETAFPVLSKIVIKITLPAAIITSFSGKEIDPSLLSLALISLGACIVYMVLAFLLNRNNKEQKAFEIINLSGYNIGNFTLPFVQSFLGPAGVITTSLFDVGNAAICLGTSHSIAALVKEGRGFSIKKVGLSLLKSIPFMTYLIMVILGLLHIRLPSPIVSCAEIIGNANAFVAMLMIGVGFKLEANRTQIGKIIKILLIRYAVAALLALVCWHLLPFDLSVRRTLMILAFSPIPSSAPAFTGDIKGDVGLASAVNSFSIIISSVVIVSLLVTTA